MFVHRIRVRYGEVDMQGVVFNAHWLAYFDDASTRFFEAIGAPLEWTGPGAQDLDVMVVRAELDWTGSARFDDEVVIRVHTARTGSSSFALRYEASVGAAPVCAATITYVCIGAEQRSVPIPSGLRTALDGAAPAADEGPIGQAPDPH